MAGIRAIGALHGRDAGTHLLPFTFLLERRLHRLEQPPLQLVPARRYLHLAHAAGHRLLDPLGLRPGAHPVAPFREFAALVAVAHLDQPTQPAGVDVRVELDSLHDLRRRHDPSCPGTVTSTPFRSRGGFPIRPFVSDKFRWSAESRHTLRGLLNGRTRDARWRRR
jgi:hypothetical protein